jgi:hypothetical protein
MVLHVQLAYHEETFLHKLTPTSGSKPNMRVSIISHSIFVGVHGDAGMRRDGKDGV